MSAADKKALAEILDRLSLASGRENARDLLNLCLRGRDIARKLEDRRSELLLTTILASTHALIEDFVGTYEHAQAALELAARQREIRDEIEIRALLSTALSRFGQVAESLAQREWALRLAKKLGDLRTSAAVANRIALDLIAAGKASSAFAFIEHGLRLTEFMQSFAGRGSQLHTAALACVATQRWGDAERYLNQAQAAQAPFPSRRWQAEFQFVRAQIAFGQGKVELALDLARELAAVFDGLGLAVRSFTVSLFYARVAAHAGHSVAHQDSLQSISQISQDLTRSRDTREGLLIRRLIRSERDAAEIPRLRKQLLESELLRLENLLGGKLDIHETKRSATSLSIGALVTAVDQMLADRVGPLVFVRITLPASITTIASTDISSSLPLYEMFELMRDRISRPVRLFARSTSDGYLSVINSGQRRVAEVVDAALDAIRSLADQHGVPIDSIAVARGVAAVVIQRAAKVSSIDLLARLDRMAAKQMSIGTVKLSHGARMR